MNSAYTVEIMDNQETPDDSPPAYDDDEALLLASTSNPDPPPPYLPVEPQQFLPPTGQPTTPCHPPGVHYVGPPQQTVEQLHQQQQVYRQSMATMCNSTDHVCNSTSITSGQINLTRGRIAAADGWFNRIRQVAPMCPPTRAYWRYLDRFSRFCTAH